MIRGRFAPTPSGDMHIGNAMAALLSWLQIRSRGGTFVLRMEDLDEPRSRPEYAKQILDDLYWLGIDWDEGPDVGGTYIPYGQSKRHALYDKTIKQLENKDLVYPCFCSRKELRRIASAPHGLGSLGAVYPGICRHLTREERQRKRKKKQPSLRFIMPDQACHFDDLVVGSKHYPSAAGGDFVIKRADGIYSYQLAVVADDAEMAVSHIMRGADLLDSTPRQIALYRALGLDVPTFAHIPLLHGPDGARLSKRHGTAINLRAMREAGRRPETVVGWLGFWSGLLDKPQSIKASDLIAEFDEKKIPAEPITLTPKVMDFFIDKT